MKKIILMLCFWCTFLATAYAENWVCFDPQTKTITKTVQGDCKLLGLCSGFNNEGLEQNCFEASKEDFEKSKDSFVKIDPAVVTGDRVIELSPEEKETIIAEQQAEIDYANSKRQKLIDKLKNLGFEDEEINLLIN